jgi:phosphatidylethanolamine-binding protein (PEBP) family uncharacterized protein
VTLLLCAASTTSAVSASRSQFVLSSSDPQLSISIPLIYTAKAFGCSGGNLSPPLNWSGAPAGTKSFVVTLFDRDERSTPSGWWEHATLLSAQVLQGRTDLGEDAYHGPCPAKGDLPIAMCSRFMR